MSISLRSVPPHPILYRSGGATASRTASDAISISDSATSSGTGLPAGSYQATVKSDSPNIFWRLNETSGTTAIDVVGTTPGTTPGTYTGGVTLGAAGPLNYVADSAPTFNGTNAYVKVAHTTALDVGDVLTIECWVYANSFTGTPILITNNTGSYILRLETTGAFTLRKGATGNIVTSTNTLNTGQWYHLAVTKNGSTVHLYCNGQDVTGTVTNATLVNNTYGAVLGAASSGTSNTGASPWFNGLISEMAIYPTALTQTRIQAHYNSGIRGTVSDSFSISDVAADTAHRALTATDAVGSITDTATVGAGRTKAATDTASITASATRTVGTGLASFDAFAVVDAITFATSTTRPRGTDSVSFTDVGMFSRVHVSIQVGDAFTMSERASAVLTVLPSLAEIVRLTSPLAGSPLRANYSYSLGTLIIPSVDFGLDALGVYVQVEGADPGEEALLCLDLGGVPFFRAYEPQWMLTGRLEGGTAGHLLFDGQISGGTPRMTGRLLVGGTP